MSHVGPLGIAVRVESDRSGSWRDRLAWATSTDVLVGVALALVFVLGHPYSGIDGDSRIYMGRALADVDPQGVGRDLMFQMDGQSAFTIFRVMAHALVAAVGLGPSVAILTAVNLAAWFAAIIVFVRTLVPGRAAALVLATAFVLPRIYTGWHLLGAGESVPVPRPLAEAAVLLALAALCQRRLLLCAAGLAVAALFHPIMAAPGIGVLLIVLGARDRRWVIAAAALGVALLGAALLGLPLASRLTATLDPAWRAILVTRNPYLFIGRWPLESLGPVVVRGATILIAGLWLERQRRMVFLASLAVGLLGAVASFLFADHLADLLVIQAQLWRALWLPAVLAPVAAGLCLWHLPSRGIAGAIALPSLALAWLALDWYPVAPVAAALALVVVYGVPRLSFPLDRRAVVAAWIACGCLAAVNEWSAISALVAVVRALPDSVPLSWAVIWGLRLASLPIAGLAVAWWRWPDAPATRLGAALVVMVGLGILVTRWDSRGPGQADADAAIRKPDLVAMLAARPGPVLWTSGDEAWQWLGRPNWNATIQGSAIVFSRDLALEWQARAEAVVAAGLAAGNLLAPLDVPLALAAPPLDAAKIAAFCRRPDAPAWIVAPLDRGTMVPAGLAARIWSPPVAPGKLVSDADSIHWQQFDRYAVLAWHPMFDGSSAG